MSKHQTVESSITVCDRVTATIEYACSGRSARYRLQREGLRTHPCLINTNIGGNIVCATDGRPLRPALRYYLARVAGVFRED